MIDASYLSTASGLETFRQVDGTRSGYRSKINIICKLFLREKLKREDLIKPNDLNPSNAKKPRVVFEMPVCQELGDRIIIEMFYWIATDSQLSKKTKKKGTKTKQNKK